MSFSRFFYLQSNLKYAYVTCDSIRRSSVVRAFVTDTSKANKLAISDRKKWIKINNATEVLGNSVMTTDTYRFWNQ